MRLTNCVFLGKLLLWALVSTTIDKAAGARCFFRPYYLCKYTSLHFIYSFIYSLFIDSMADLL